MPCCIVTTSLKRRRARAERGRDRADPHRFQWSFEERNARLLAGKFDGEFAITDPAGKALRIFGRGLFAISGNEFSKGGEQAALRHAVAIDPVETRFGPGLLQISKRNLFLLEIRYRLSGRLWAR